jgi:uncharacterized protein (TIGR02301 family)
MCHFSVGLDGDNAAPSRRKAKFPRTWTAMSHVSMLMRVLMAVLLTLATAHGPARAQATSAAPFDASLARLAEILGALHYLRGICGANEGPKWRNEMQALIDAEAPSGDRRARMISSFNRGYRGFQQTYRTCTPAADLVIRRYLEEGSKIARETTARYAN